MSDDVIMKVSQRRRAAPPHHKAEPPHHKKAGRTSIESDIDDLNDEIMLGRPGSKSRGSLGFNEWDDIPRKSDIDPSGEDFSHKEDLPFYNKADWFKKHQEMLKQELDIDRDKQADI